MASTLRASDKQFNPRRLKLARVRRQLTIKALAESVGLSAKMVSSYEKDGCTHVPTEKTIEAYSRALRYPYQFFFQLDEFEEVSQDTVSFRSLKSMKAAQQHAAIGSATIGLMVNDFFENKFNLPEHNLPDLRGVGPKSAAELVREHWGIGSKSISNVIHLLEINGIRVYSLSENTQAVDAFSFWKDTRPFIFLNTRKSGERSRFDAAHELGHLLLHQHGTPQGKDVEAEADAFASHFLMPRKTILAQCQGNVSLRDIINLKQNWKVSAMALIMQMKNLGLLTEWQHRGLIIDASRAGLRTSEINGIDHEQSLIIGKILDSLKSEGISISNIASQLNLPVEEVSNILFKVSLIEGGVRTNPNINRPTLRLVKN